MLTITSGSVLTPQGFMPRDVTTQMRQIVDASQDERRLDAAGLLVLPGIVDIHGDAFERQIMPRPGVSFDLSTALADTDRQLVANGITRGSYFTDDQTLRGLGSHEICHPD